LAVQDIYHIGAEKIVVGKVLSGQIHQGQELRIFPRRQDVKVNAIRIFQGTINKDLIQTYLEFCLACVLYTQSVAFDKISIKGFKII
jgi:translation elongation factor EF-1alpha